jgi:nucleoprotein TPR
MNLNFGFQLESEISESASSLRRSKERVSELEQRVSKMEKVKFLTDGCAISLIHRLTFAVSSFDE